MFVYPLTSWSGISQRYWTKWYFAPWKWHRAIDYVAPAGQPIYPAQEGHVIRDRYDRAYGWFVEVQHENGMSTLYAHLDGGSLLNVGDLVHMHTQLGRVGNTGLSTGAHLHFELRKNGTKVNPESYNFITRQTYMELENKVAELERYRKTCDDRFSNVVEKFKSVDKKIKNRPTKKEVKQMIGKQYKTRSQPLRTRLKKISKALNIWKPKVKGANKD